MKLSKVLKVKTDKPGHMSMPKEKPMKIKKGRLYKALKKG